MRTAYTVEQIRAAEADLMATLPAGTLMQRAAAGLATACADYLGRVYGARVLVLAGSGDNGGDALWAGARLAARGARVDAMLMSDRTHADGLAALRAAGGRVVAQPDGAASGADLVLDGIVGIGGWPGLRPQAHEALLHVSAPIVAVDVPSGIDVDAGEASDAHVQAEFTVAFGGLKVGLLLDPAASAAGPVELVDIGLAPCLGAPAVEALQATDVGRLIPTPPHSAQKYARGVVGVAAGSEEYSGAGLLATGGAVLSGLAGMVRYYGPSADLVRSQHPEVVVGRGQVQAWVVGPGMGDGRAADVADLLAEGVPTVIDADGLRSLPMHLSSPAVLTPHAGELARMLETDRSAVEARMLAHARQAAERWNAVVLLKGARSVIVAPDGRVRVNTTGVPWMATAGAGDVLSGLIGALLAAGLEPFDAASVGAWLHGSAGSLASSGGPLTAAGLADVLPDAVALTLAG
jgi:ADP-dependent NAD(P)H-hydrate dehydratase / NAD(P)H-hydrate epimerase